MIDFRAFPHPGIRNLIPYKPGKSRSEFSNKAIIKLASNENPLGCSTKVYTSLASLTLEDISNYPAPLTHPIYKKLADFLNIESSQLLLSNGSDYLYTLLIKSFALHRDKFLLTHEYAFRTYEIQAATLGVGVKKSKVAENWQLDVESLIKHCNDNIGLICFANPNNPTGSILSNLEIINILDNVAKNVIVIIDEAYSEYATTSLKLLEKYPNLIITRTFSKAYGLAGLRLGYAVGSAKIISILKKIQLPFMVNQAALNAGLAALDDQEFINKSVALNNAGRTQILNNLKLATLPANGNFITLNCLEDSQRLNNFLLGKNIVTRPLHEYGMLNYLRVTIGDNSQNKIFLQVIKEYLDERS